MTTTATRKATESRYRFWYVAHMEWVKLRSLRSTFWLLAATATSMIGIGVVALSVYRTHLPRATAAQMVNNGMAGVALGQLLIGFLGVLVMTNEYSSGLIRSTFAAAPNRMLVLAAKAVVFGMLTFAVCEAMSFVTFFASQAALTGSGVPQSTLGDAGVLRTVMLSGLYLCLFGLIGLGLGAVLRRTGATIGALFGLLLVPMIIAGAFGSAGIGVLKFMPMFILINSVSVVTPVGGTLSAWAGIGVLAAYATLALGVGGWFLSRRDV